MRSAATRLHHVAADLIAAATAALGRKRTCRISAPCARSCLWHSNLDAAREDAISPIRLCPAPNPGKRRNPVRGADALDAVDCCTNSRRPRRCPGDLCRRHSMRGCVLRCSEPISESESGWNDRRRTSMGFLPIWVAGNKSSNRLAAEALVDEAPESSEP
jgi:hypothetical protein